MAAPRFSIIATRAWIDGTFRPARVSVADGVISEIALLSSPYDPVAAPPEGDLYRLPDDTVLLPGLVDSHVHVNDPGRTEWEGFRSATLAAAAGGVTTIVDMPLNSIPPTITAKALQAKRKVAGRKAFVDVGFWGGAVPENLVFLAELHAAGVYGFKCFLSPSGVDEFGHLDADQLLLAMREVAALGSVLIVHAEDPTFLGEEGALGTAYDAFLRSRPPRSERSAIAAVIDAVRLTGCRTHILHLSDGSALADIRAAKREGLPLSVETCPHYLTIAAEEIPDGASEFKCCPPIREAGNRDLLWQGVQDGTIDAIVSDHSPSTVAMKRAGDGDFGLAWGGISGLQLGLSAVWTEAWKRRITLPEILPLFTTGPARIAGLEGAGRIEVGRPAHLTVFGPDRPMFVDARELQHRNPITAYEGRTFAGRVLRTWLHGESIFDARDGGAGQAPFLRRSPKGRLLSARGRVSP